MERVAEAALFYCLDVNALTEEQNPITHKVI